MVLPDGLWPSFKLLDKDTPAHIRFSAVLEERAFLAIIMNLVHENVLFGDI